MEDVQNHPAPVPIRIDRVGLRSLRLPLIVRDRALGKQSTVATVDIGVELPSAYKGTHMSRFVEVLEDWSEELDYRSLKRLLERVKCRLHASKAYARFAFPYFIRKEAPSSRIPGPLCYDCCITGELAGGAPSIFLEVDVPLMTVCPCSKAISDEGAHSQRALVRLSIRMTGFSWLEEFIDIAEQSGSSPVYTLLKREDEKAVTEQAFAHPCFVEDVVRHVAARLERHPHVAWFRVEVESFESIHGHNAFACIERTIQPDR